MSCERIISALNPLAVKHEELHIEIRFQKHILNSSILPPFLTLLLGGQPLARELILAAGDFQPSHVISFVLVHNEDAQWEGKAAVSTGLTRENSEIRLVIPPSGRPAGHALIKQSDGASLHACMRVARVATGSL